MYLSDIKNAVASLTRELLAGGKEGSGNDWKRLLHLHAPLVYCWLKLSGCDIQTARLVTSEALERAYNDINTFAEDSAEPSFRSWLFEHTVATAAGRGISFAAEINQEASLDERIVYREFLRHVIVTEFSRADWAVFKTTVIEGSDPVDLANVLGMDMPGVYLRKSRVLHHILGNRQGISETIPLGDESTACPSRQRLSAFNSGRLDLTSVDTVGNHLKGCERCQQILRGMASDLSGIGGVLRLERRFEDWLREIEDEEVVGERAEDTRFECPITDFLPSSFSTMESQGETREWETKISTEPSIPNVIGPYKIRREIAHGGMGIVYEAEHTRMHRRVALKMILAMVRADDRRRFNIECDALAKLQHPHVIEVFDFDEQFGKPFFAMELMEGGNLEEAADSFDGRYREIAKLLETLAETMDAVHEAGIIHRDLKPSNIMFTAASVPKISDFGLAKIEGETDSDPGELTGNQEVLGSPSYMAPEQASAQHHRIGPSADIYALGGILYRLLAGRPPHVGNSRRETLEMVRQGKIVKPSIIRQSIPLGLEAICLKCLTTQMEGRYKSASELGEDLNRFSNGKTPLALSEQQWFRTRRRMMLAGGATVAVGAAFVAWRELDPDAPVRRHNQKLATDQVAVLVGETGLPAWHQIEGDAANAQLTTQNSITQLSSEGGTLVSLLPHIIKDTFRFEAELRQISGSRDGGIGIFVGKQTGVFAGESRTLCVMIRFDESDDDKADYDRMEKIREANPALRGRPVGPRPDGNFVHLLVYALAPPGKGTNHDQKYYGARDTYRPFIRSWRKVRLDVSPKGVWAEFDNSGKLLALPAADITSKFSSLVKSQATFDSQAGIGIFAKGATVQFKNVTLR